MNQFDNIPFYLRLFQFARSSENGRERREDFLTEIVAELFRQLVKSKPKALRSLFQDVLLKAAKNPEKVRSFVDHLADPEVEVEVSTQRRVKVIQGETSEERQPDIVMRCRGRDFCIIENKLGASFTDNQLPNYDKYLIQQQPNTEQSEPALILITQFTGPPPGFLDPSSGDYCTGVRSVAYWWRIADWIDRQLAQQDSVGPEWRFIAGRLRELMEKWNMTVKNLSPDDLKTLRLFLANGTKKRVVIAFEEIRRELKSKYQAYNFNKNNSKWSNDYPIYEDWIQDTQDQGSFIFGWGVVFASEQQPYFGVPEKDLAICYLKVESDFSKKYIEEDQKWHVPQSHDYIYRWCDLCELVSSSDGFIKSMVDWVEESLTQAKGIHERLERGG